jgi:trimeric autotransporter adhesin
MKLQILNSTLSRIVGSVALLLLQFVPCAFADNNRELGKISFENNCLGCHAPSAKANRTALEISDAIASNAGMRESIASSNGNTPLTSDQISDIAAYLGTAPDFTFSIAELSPTTGDFGPISVGRRANRFFLLTNTGDAPLTVGTVTLSDTTNYTMTDNCSNTSVAIRGSCTVEITFTPPSAGSFNGRTLTFPHNAFGSPEIVTLNGTGFVTPQGVLEINASSLSFPDTQFRLTSVPQSLTLTNTGTAPLSFSAFTVTGSHPSDFTHSGTCSTATPLAIADTCTLTMAFAPSGLGLRSAVLTISHNGSNASASVPLSGTGIPVPVPVVLLNPAPAIGLPFGPQTVGGLYRARTLRLTNSGTGIMAIESIVIEGAAFANTIVAPCPASLAAGASCDIQIKFTATGAGTSSTGAVRVTTNAAGSPHVVPLSGSGTLAMVPVLEWAPSLAQLDFGNISVGAISPVQSATLRNAGPGGIMLSFVNTVGTDPSMFSVGSNPRDTAACSAGSLLYEDTTCRVDVRFAPGLNGARSATVQVASSGSSPPTLTLVGTGSSGPVPTLSLAPTALSFAATRVGSASAPAEVLVQSGGAGTLTVQSITINGPFATQSKTCPAVPFTLSAGSTCSITVTFVPKVQGDAGGTLTIVSDDSPAGKAVGLTARADAASPDSQASGCSISDGRSPTDPTLWTLVLLAAAVLFYRRRKRAGA